MADDTTSLQRQLWLRTLYSLPVFAVILFAPAGTLHYWQGWIFGIVFAGSSTALGAYFLRHDPELIKRRMRAGPAAEQRPAQKIIMSLTLFGFLLLMVLPGFDHRLQHGSPVPAWLTIAANAGIAVSFWFFFLVLRQNSYAASTIQVEAGQPVISTGLYSMVRHPLYAAAVLLLFCIPLALGSYWTLLIVVPMLPVLGWRLIDEEHFLVHNLPGYADYCQQVRFRLIPGIW